MQTEIFSKEFIKANFYFTDDDVLYFNHGSYGICPRLVLEEKLNILRRFEQNPVKEFSETMFDGCYEATKILGERIGVSYKNLAIVANVTQGFCSILKSMKVNHGDEILLTNFTYETIRIETEEILSPKGVVVRTLELVQPFQSKEAITNLYTRFVMDHPQIKYAIIDHIPSGLPMVQPVKDIVKALRQLGVFVMIDGAHVAGHLKDLNVEDIDADVYIGNLHKWCFLPRGTGFLAIREGLDINIKPPVVSFLQDHELYLRFVYMGTNDFSNTLCVKKAFEFVDMIGGFDRFHPAIVSLLERGVKYLEHSWNVTSITFPENAPLLRLVPLPEGFDKHKEMIMKEIRIPFQRRYYAYTLRKLKFVATLVLVDGRMTFRLGCHIYNTFDHFVQFSERVMKWLQLLDNGETLDMYQ